MSSDQQTPLHLMRHVLPDESAADFFRRQKQEAVATGLPFIDAHIKLRPGHILELVGPSGSAKSQLLVQIVAHFLCSTSHYQGEEQEHAVVVDCDGKFDVLMVMLAIKARQQVPLTVLSRLHLVRCFNTLELLLALNALPQQVPAIQGRCKLLMIDNVAAHITHDKAAVFNAANQQLPFSGLPSSSCIEHVLQQQHLLQQQQCVEAAGTSMQLQRHAVLRSAGPGFDALRVQGAVALLLQHLSQQLRLPVVWTKQAAVNHVEKPTGAVLMQRENLTAPLQRAVSHRLLLSSTAAQAHVDISGGQAPRGHTVMLQWQAGDDVGPLQKCLLGDAGVLQLTS